MASLAHDDLVSFWVELFPYSSCASRVWELRSTVTAYHACYVALAEILVADVATLKVRLSRASGLAASSLCRLSRQRRGLNSGCR